MNVRKYLLLCAFAMGLAANDVMAQGQETDFEQQRREQDPHPVREFIQSKENIDLKDKSDNLELSGDVRFEWRHLNEKGYRFFVDDSSDTFFQRYETLRGDGVRDYRGNLVSKNDWDVEFNLKLKYSYQRSWMAAHVQYDNSAGIRGHNDCIVRTAAGDVVLVRDSRRGCKGSGEGNSLNLKRAYMGYNAYADGDERLDIEIGRRKLDDIFDSEIQFSNRFDGILLKYASAIDRFADWYCYIGGFVIDERVNHIGGATEVGLLDIFDSGLDLKYSYINWNNKHHNRCDYPWARGLDFKISQFTFSYHFNPDLFCGKPVELYGAFLINHAARKSTVVGIESQGFRRIHDRANLGWYLGLYIGEVDKQGDWSIDILYEYVGAQAVSDCDVGGIGRGNILDERFTDVYKLVDGDEVLDIIIPRRGNANFTGLKVEALYAVTDNLSLDVQYEFTRAANKKFGGRHNYSNFEIEAIYAF